MAKFVKIENTWINIDTIVSMWYDKDEDATFIFSCDDPTEHFSFKGDIINYILNANNDITMHDKLFANHIADKIKSPLSSILARIDSLEKEVRKLT